MGLIVVFTMSFIMAADAIKEVGATGAGVAGSEFPTGGASVKHFFSARHCKESDDEEGVSGWGELSVGGENGGGVFGLRCKISPNVNTGILFFSTFR